VGRKIKKSTPEQASGWGTGNIGTCNVHGGKKLWTSRKVAREAARKMHEPGLRAYPCDARPDMWHIGHIPGPIRAGTEDPWPLSPRTPTWP
jgi:hypothetical protein